MAWHWESQDEPDEHQSLRENVKHHPKRFKTLQVFVIWTIWKLAGIICWLQGYKVFQSNLHFWGCYSSTFFLEPQGGLSLWISPAQLADIPTSESIKKKITEVMMNIKAPGISEISVQKCPTIALAIRCLNRKFWLKVLQLDFNTFWGWRFFRYRQFRQLGWSQVCRWSRWRPKPTKQE